MPKYTVTIQGDSGDPKTVIVDTDGMSASVVDPVVAQTATIVSQGGKRSSSSFRLKKRRITRKLKRTR